MFEGWRAIAFESFRVWGFGIGWKDALGLAQNICFGRAPYGGARAGRVGLVSSDWHEFRVKGWGGTRLGVGVSRRSPIVVVEGDLWWF